MFEETLKERRERLEKEKIAKKNALYFSLILMSLTALVYGLIYLFTGHVPTVKSIEYFYYSNGATPNAEEIEKVYTFPLPIDIPRWLDIFLVGIICLTISRLQIWYGRMDFWDRLNYFPIRMLIIMFFELAFFIASVHLHWDPFSIYFMILSGAWVVYIFFAILMGNYLDVWRSDMLENASIAIISTLFLGLKIGLLLSSILGIFIFIAYDSVSILGIGIIGISVLLKKAFIFLTSLTKKTVEPII